jgi:hypothetical protein
MSDKVLTEAQYNVLLALRPEMARCADFKAGLPYQVELFGPRLRLFFTSLDEGEYPGFDRQVDTTARIALMDIVDLAQFFGVPCGPCGEEEWQRRVAR